MMKKTSATDRTAVLKVSTAWGCFADKSATTG